MKNPETEMENELNLCFSIPKPEREKITNLKNAFKEIRNTWKLRVEEHESAISTLKGISKNKLITDRQIVIEEIYSFQEKAIRKYRELKQAKKISFERFESNSKAKSFQAISILIDGENSELEELCEILSNHINYLSETLRSIDHLLYAIKTKIKLEELGEL